MKVEFDEKDRTKILQRIKEAMGGRTLGDIVDFGLDAGLLRITISKLGTSVIEFRESNTASGLLYELKSEKIALTHRAFKEEVTDKILRVIEKAGGKVQR